MTEKHLTNTTFSTFSLAPDLISALTEAGFNYCTPIQAQALPLALAGRDVIGQAQTGTGKTLTFLVAVFNRLLTSPAPTAPNQPRAIVIAPTRELAIQIHKDAMQLNPAMQFRIEAVYGGVDYEKQRRKLSEGVDILIGTPGRIIDFFKQKVFNLRHIQAAVLDEADRMFDLGFIKDIRFMLRRLPPPEERLTLMFSATLSYRVTELAYEHMNNPQVVKVETSEVTADKIEQFAYYVSNEEKISLLLGIFRKFQPERAIIFINTKAEAEKVCRYLIGNDIHANVLSGDIPQKQRQRLVTQFQQGEVNVLVATDIAARGLHIENVTHVINYDLPQEAEDYVHRIGRTGRIGATGVAISLACEKYAFHLPDIEEYIGKKIRSESVTSDLLVEPKPPGTLSVAKTKPRHAGRKPTEGGAHQKRRRRHGKPKTGG